jgi:hypothetical protein
MDSVSQVALTLFPGAMLEEVLGSFLFMGMGLSHMRRAEDLHPSTRAVWLHFPTEEHGDFTLEVYLCPSFGKCILEVIKLCASRGLLGEYLFDASDPLVSFGLSKVLGYNGT